MLNIINSPLKVPIASKSSLRDSKLPIVFLLGNANCLTNLSYIKSQNFNIPYEQPDINYD